MMRASVHEDMESLSRAAARRIAELAGEAIAVRGLFRIALAGGETPRRCYEQLCSLPLDWSRVKVYFGDERCLPAGDPQRNDVMARAALLDRVDIPASGVYPIPAELGADAAAAKYAQALGSEPLDLVLLGMGEDGHTASLFPGNPASASHEAVVAVYGAPKPPPERVSLGMDTLNAARHKLFLVAGSGKRAALERIGRGERLPAAAVADAEWFLDSAASGDSLKIDNR